MLVDCTGDRNCTHVQQVDKVCEAAQLGVSVPCDLQHAKTYNVTGVGTCTAHGANGGVHIRDLVRNATHSTQHLWLWLPYKQCLVKSTVQKSKVYASRRGLWEALDRPMASWPLKTGHQQWINQQRIKATICLLVNGTRMAAVQHVLICRTCLIPVILRSLHHNHT